MSPVARRRSICFVVEGLAGLSGGAERVLVETANAMAERGHDVEVVTHELSNGPPFYPLSEDVTLTRLRPLRHERSQSRRELDRLRRFADRHVYRHELHRIPLVGRLACFNRFGGFRRRLEHHLNAVRPDVAVAFMPTAIMALGLARPNRSLRKVASTHNLPEVNFEGRAGQNINPAYRAAVLRSLQAFDSITILLEENRRWYPEALKRRLVVLPNAVKPVPQPLRERPRERLVLAISRLHPQKRPDILVEAWARIAPSFPDWRLEIYGKGPLENEIAALIETRRVGDSLRLMGHTPDIAERLADAAVLAHPAAHEGFGLAPAEALATGVPVVGFADCSGLNALVKNGETGRLADPPASGEDEREGRISAFAKALAELMANRALRERLGDAGPEAMAAYAPERIQDLWEEVLCGRLPRLSPDRPDA